MRHDVEKLQEKLLNEHVEEEEEITLWDKWDKEEKPDTFGFLELAKDGGFSEVQALYRHSRWLSALVLVIFVIYNVAALISLDLDFIRDPDSAAIDLGTTLSEIDKFYFSRSITHLICGLLGVPTPQPVRVIGALELLGMSYFLMDLVYCCVLVKCESGFRKWFHVQRIFWEILPTLSVYSAMKLLYDIVPVVFLASVSEHAARVEEYREEGNSMLPVWSGILWWLLRCVFGFIVGFDTFLMKLRVVSASASETKLSAAVFLPTVQFLVQVLGVVQLGVYVRSRLFLFIFGGEDGVMQEGEIIRMTTWNAQLAKRIYNTFSFAKFIAVMASFSDEDFQSLVLNENEAVKTQEAKMIGEMQKRFSSAKSTAKGINGKAEAKVARANEALRMGASKSEAIKDGPRLMDA